MILNFTNRFRYYITVTHKQLTFSESTSLSKKGAVILPLPLLSFSFQVFFFKNWLSLECFFYDVGDLSPNLSNNFLIFSNNNYDLK